MEVGLLECLCIRVRPSHITRETEGRSYYAAWYIYTVLFLLLSNSDELEDTRITVCTRQATRTHKPIRLRAGDQKGLKTRLLSYTIVSQDQIKPKDGKDMCMLAGLARLALVSNHLSMSMLTPAPLSSLPRFPGPCLPLYLDVRPAIISNRLPGLP